MEQELFNKEVEKILLFNELQEKMFLVLHIEQKHSANNFFNYCNQQLKVTFRVNKEEYTFEVLVIGQDEDNGNDIVFLEREFDTNFLSMTEEEINNHFKLKKEKELEYAKKQRESWIKSQEDITIERYINLIKEKPELFVERE